MADAALSRSQRTPAEGTVDKLIGLATHEDRVHALSMQKAQTDPDLRVSFELLELTIDVMFLLAKGELTTDDEKTLSTLCARVFNSIVAARRVAFCGYPLTGFSILRELLDTLTLLHYFRADPAAIARWRQVQPGEPLGEWSAYKMRMRIQKTRPSAATFLQDEYARYSHYVAHTTYASLLILPGPRARRCLVRMQASPGCRRSFST
jgi:hypothetical protein